MIFKPMILTYLINVVGSLQSIHNGTLMVKIFSSIKLSFLLSPIAILFELMSRWGVDNQEYIIIVLAAIAIDHILGSLKHLFIDRDFTWRKNITGIAVKIGLVVAVGFLFEGLNEIIHKQSVVKDYLTITTRMIVFFYPAGSAFGNSSVLSGGKFPPSAWMIRLKSFQKNLDPKDLMKKNEDE